MSPFVAEVLGIAMPEPKLDRDAEVEAYRARREAEQRDQRRAAWLDASGIPSELREAKLFGDALATQAVVAVREFLGLERAGDTPALSGRCLVLAGSTGVGKSYAAAAALLALASGRLWYFPALCGALMDSARRPDALHSASSTAGLIVLDDLGVEFVKEGGFLAAMFDEIVWHREGERRPTIITTNLTTEELRERLSDRIVDRLRGRWGSIVECQGESLR